MIKIIVIFLLYLTLVIGIPLSIEAIKKHLHTQNTPKEICECSFEKNNSFILGFVTGQAIN